MKTISSIIKTSIPHFKATANFFPGIMTWETSNAAHLSLAPVYWDIEKSNTANPFKTLHLLLTQANRYTRFNLHSVAMHCKQVEVCLVSRWLVDQMVPL